MNIKDVTAQMLARKFSELLRVQLSGKEMGQVISRNRREKDSRICHSHDFCDANVFMDEAFKALTGRNATDTYADGPADQAPCMSNEAVALWNSAWTLAKEKEFREEEI